MTPATRNPRRNEPRRKRSLWSSLRRVFVLLTLAFFVNVLVAWGLAWWNPKAWANGEIAHGPFTMMGGLGKDSDRATYLDDLPQYGTPWSLRFAHQLETGSLHNGNWDWFYYLEGQYGFPFRSMAWGELIDPTTNTSVTPDTWGWRFRRGQELGPDLYPIVSGFSSWRLPLVPILFGTIYNTLIYAALISLAITFFSHHRRLRRFERGLCPDCGYNAQGLTACPECGRVPPLRLAPSPAAGGEVSWGGET